MEIEVKKLNFELDNKKILKDISFEINKGEIVALIGLNSSGKSSLLKVLAGYYKARGLVKMDNKKDVFFLDDGLVMFKEFTVFELLKYYSDLYQKDLENGIDYLTKWNFPDIYQTQISQISSGMRKRLSIAIAFMINPQLLILDEPTNFLDSSFDAMFYANLLNLQKMNHNTIIISSHNISDLEEIADRFLIINNGSLIDSFTRDELEKRLLSLRFNDIKYRDYLAIYKKYEKDIKSCLYFNGAAIFFAENFVLQKMGKVYPDALMVQSSLKTYYLAISNASDKLY